MLGPGVHAVKPVSASLGKTKNGKDEVQITFGNEKGNIIYRGYLTDKAKDYTLDNLLRCGFNGKSLADLNANPNCIDKNKELEIVVEAEEYNGKFYNKVKFINEPFEKASESDAAKYDGDLLAKMQEKGISPGQNYSSDDVPF